MTSQEVLRRMTEPSAPTPAMRDLVAVYAMLVAAASDRLDPGEIDSFVALGVAIHRRDEKPVTFLSTVP
ncbi:hypothetical protein [Paracidovorax wautersii]|uniref:Uncharacterized protein n=1 Tax=Paracidovorax wautersii TaxID=1177982 RepID=A0ABU1IDK2_9BURK|nr:hypothetical protein [Paracidovorax wautersii]MDR6215310.1 hypothetical protein [Paracidovorax wautersii]